VQAVKKHRAIETGKRLQTSKPLLVGEAQGNGKTSAAKHQTSSMPLVIHAFESHGPSRTAYAGVKRRAAFARPP
jgi:hypothetical protein